MYLLDTNVISELRKAKPHGGVAAWINRIRADRVYLSAIVVGELQSVTRNLKDSAVFRVKLVNPFLKRLS